MKRREKNPPESKPYHPPVSRLRVGPRCPDRSGPVRRSATAHHNTLRLCLSMLISWSCMQSQPPRATVAPRPARARAGRHAALYATHRHADRPADRPLRWPAVTATGEWTARSPRQAQHHGLLLQSGVQKHASLRSAGSVHPSNELHELARESARKAPDSADEHVVLLLLPVLEDEGRRVRAGPRRRRRGERR